MNSRYLIVLRLIRYKAYNNKLVPVNNRGKCKGESMPSEFTRTRANLLGCELRS